MSAADIVEWEGIHGKVPRKALVCIRTGWSKKFNGDHKIYMGYDLGDGSCGHAPGFSVEAAQLLVERDVAGLGIDTASIDPGNSSEFPVHTYFLRTDRY